MNLTVTIPQRKKIDNSTVQIKACDFYSKTYMSDVAYRIASDVAHCKKEETFNGKRK